MSFVEEKKYKIIIVDRITKAIMSEYKITDEQMANIVVYLEDGDRSVLTVGSKKGK